MAIANSYPASFKYEYPCTGRHIIKTTSPSHFPYFKNLVIITYNTTLQNTHEPSPPFSTSNSNSNSNPSFLNPIQNSILKARIIASHKPQHTDARTRHFSHHSISHVRHKPPSRQRVDRAALVVWKESRERDCGLFLVRFFFVRGEGR